MKVYANIISHLPQVAANSPAHAKSATAPERQQLPAGGKESPQPVDVEDLRSQLVEAAGIISDLVDNLNLDSDLQFKVDEDTGVNVITVLDGETGEVIRRLPSEESLAISRYIAEFSNAPPIGLLMDSVE